MLLEEYISIEQSKALSRQSLGMLLTMMSVTVLSSYVLWNHIPKHLILFWFSSALLLAFFRWWTTKSYTAETTKESNYKKRLKMFTFWSVMSGLHWSSIAYFVSDPNAQIYVVYLICVTSGYATTATLASSYMPLTLSFVASILSLFFVNYIASDYLLYKYLAFSVPFFFVVIWAFASVANKTFKAAKKLEYDNAHLLREITEKNLIAENAIIEKNHFLAATSHDLRQPLHAMGLYLDTLKPRLTNSFDANVLSKLSQSNVALNELLHSLLDISRLDASIVQNRPQHIYLAKITQQLASEFSSQADQKCLELQLTVDPQHVVFADPLLLERVLRNLISNGIKYTDTGCVKIVSEIHNEKMLINVIDTGIGVSPQDIDKIFLEYKQLDNPERDRNKGLGLGLPIVKRLCHLQNIPFDFNSTRNQGTNVRLTVALGDPALCAIKTNKDTFLPRSLNILFVDDEQVIRDAMELVISSWQCRSLIASNKDEAMTAVQDLDDNVDIIISDLRLRDNQTGIELVNQIREELNDDIPAIIVTGDTGVDRLMLAKNANVELMHKPISPAQLRNKIEHLINLNQS